MISRPITSINQAGLLAWAAFENTNNDANVYIRPNPGNAHPWLFMDDLPGSVATAICHKYKSLIIQTSLGNYQARLLANRPLNTRERGTVQAALVARLRGSADPGSTAGDKWGRLPGFRQRKPGKETWTNLITDSTSQAAVFDPSPYLVHPKPAFSFPLRGGVGYREDGHGGFREEFAFACHCLRRQEQEEVIVSKIAKHALTRGKRRSMKQAESYARKLLDQAQARLRE